MAGKESTLSREYITSVEWLQRLKNVEAIQITTPQDKLYPRFLKGKLIDVSGYVEMNGVPWRFKATPYKRELGYLASIKLNEDLQAKTNWSLDRPYSLLRHPLQLKPLSMSEVDLKAGFEHFGVDIEDMKQVFGRLHQEGHGTRELEREFHRRHDQFREKKVLDRDKKLLGAGMNLQRGLEALYLKEFERRQENDRWYFLHRFGVPAEDVLIAQAGNGVADLLLDELRKRSDQYTDFDRMYDNYSYVPLIYAAAVSRTCDKFEEAWKEKHRR